MADEFVWMKHPDGTEPAPFAADSVEFWKARGWEPTKKPAEPDPTVDPAATPVESTTTDSRSEVKARTVGRSRRGAGEEQ